MNELEHIIEQIVPLDRAKLQAGHAYCDSLAKPLGALGKLESAYARLFAIFDGRIDLAKKIVLVYVADNGIAEAGVSANPQETTYTVASNILAGKTGLCAISDHVGSDICLVDIGCKKDIFKESRDKVCAGSRNMLLEPALTRTQALEAVLVGYEKTKSLIGQGYRLFGTGEMGIGNTTTSAAVIAAALGLPAAEVTGYGAGLTQAMKAHKTAVIEQCLKQHAPYGDILDIAAKLGGLDMLGMAGTHLACARYRLPCVVDGLISLTGLLIASRLSPSVVDYVFASHASTEPGYQIVSRHLGLEPMLLLEMRLGEGSGCPLAFFLLENAVYTMEHMPTFEEGRLKKEDYIDIRDQ
ncbi:nicotinate-nucleotide--dimethylbenzimidazole phosphoribosyltransferase [Streptococcus panodentis]|uniref:Nicotinate-nucleotide--dimethylbenzimidazole phosphoribosyltransferase n=1 Tax=Streptococcus panodentis TaxID=1581472 RepID=A0ABS5AXN0_9STRE|nr:nicotinate-nucleotide--dimethylbenzimidazole phosphoribosyltransferase [Streptococcus panodentis]MBP2621338.1 nicotinate-nucleotide--dimethylbenzimidazole phosphoribosyltransferase [Streptococcus panodentis]